MVTGAFPGEAHVLTLKLSISDGDQTIESIRGFVNETRLVKDSPVIIRAADDNDGDWVSDDEDAFPDDPAASVDSDNDGAPDEWNPRATHMDRV